MCKVTVVVPVYNVEKYLQRCLDSLLNQSYNDYEIICINDCSPDNCKNILQEYEGRYPEKITVLENEENMGQGRSRMRGVKLAKGDYVMFVDSDDYVREDYIQTYLTNMVEKNCDVVIGGYTKDISGKYYEYKVSNSIWSILTYSIGCAKMFSKEFLLKNNIDFSDLRCAEDIYFSLCVYYYNATYSVIDYTGYYYYFNSKSTTSSINYDRKFEATIAEIFDKFMDNCDLSKLSVQRRQAIEYTYLANMINALITYGHGGKWQRMKSKYEFFMKDLNQRFPDYKKNSYVGILKPKGQSAKIRLGVGVTIFLNRLHLDRLLFYMIAYL